MLRTTLAKMEHEKFRLARGSKRIFFVCCPLCRERVTLQFSCFLPPLAKIAHEKSGSVTRPSTFLRQRSLRSFKDSVMRHLESRTIKCAERYSMNLSTLPGSSSFVSAPRRLSASVQCIAMPPMEYIDPVIRVRWMVIPFYGTTGGDTSFSVSWSCDGF